MIGQVSMASDRGQLPMVGVDRGLIMGEMTNECSVRIALGDDLLET